MLLPECSMQGVLRMPLPYANGWESRLMPYLMKGSTAERNGVPLQTWAIAQSLLHLVSTVTPRDTGMHPCYCENYLNATLTA